MHTYIGLEVGHRNTNQTLVSSWPGSTWLVRWLPRHTSPLPVSAAGLAPATWYTFSFIETFMLLGQFHKRVKQGLLLGCMSSTSVEVQDSLVCTCLYCLVSLPFGVAPPHHIDTNYWCLIHTYPVPLFSHHNTYFWCRSISRLLNDTIFMFVPSAFFLAFSWAIWHGPVFVLFSEPKEVVVHETAKT